METRRPGVCCLSDVLEESEGPGQEVGGSFAGGTG